MRAQRNHPYAEMMTTRERPGLTLLLGALIAIAPLAMDIYLASMPSMTTALHASTAQVQATLSVYMAGWGLAQLLVGPISDRFGRRPVLLSGLLLFTVASFACAFALTIEQLIVGRLFQALGMAGAAVVPRAVVRDLYAGERAARMLSLMGVVLGIAPIIAPVLGSHLHVWFGWPANFLFVAGYGALLMVAGGMFLPETLRHADPRATNPRQIAQHFRLLLCSRIFVGYTAVGALATAGLFAFLSGSAFVFVGVMGAGEQGFGLLFALVMLGNITGAMLGSRLVTRLGIDRLLAYSTSLMLLSGVTLAALAWCEIDHPFAVVVPMFFFMVSFTSTMPQASAGALTPHADRAGAAASLMSFTQFCVAALGGLAVGLTFDGTARPMTTTIAVSAALSFIALRVLKPTTARYPQHR